MTRLEEDIRAATRARAGEITPDQIRPLDLAVTRPVQRIPGGRRRWAAPVAAAAAAAVIAAGLAGVGAGHGRPSAAPASRRTGQAARTGPAAQASGAAARLDQQVLGLFVPATGPQYAAGTQLNGTIQALEVDGTARCLARHGVTVPVPPPASLAARYATNYVDNSQFPDLTRISRTHVFVPAWFIEPLKPPTGQGQAFHRWLGPCQAAARAVFAPLLSAGQRLGDGTWAALLTQAPAAGPVRGTLGALRTCAARYGWPASPYGPPAGVIRSFGDFGSWVFGHLDGAGSRGASAAALRRLGRHWTAVFVRCGQPTLAAQNQWLAAQQARFAREHAGQVRAVEALARRALRQAQGRAS
jgi:hypothetical protein